MVGSGQLRRRVKDVFKNRAFTLVVGSNLDSKEDVFAVGEEFGLGVMWIHLPRSEVKRLFKDFEDGKRGEDNER